MPLSSLKATQGLLPWNTNFGVGTKTSTRRPCVARLLYWQGTAQAE